jgi:FSR family fosmidomycin resistance protein-like MFS transporter
MESYRNKTLLALAFGHLVLEIYFNLLPVAYPLLMSSLGLSYAMIGFLATAASMSSAFLQPFFGYLSDRFGNRLLGSVAVAWTALGMSLVGFAPSYGILMGLVIMAAIGSAIYHPQGASGAAIVGGDRRRGTALSVFSVGGNIGFALGPLVGILVFPWIGLKGAIFLAPLGLLLTPLLYRSMGVVDHQRRARALAGRNVPSAPLFLGPLVLLVVIMILRTWTSFSLETYITLLQKSRGGGLGEGGQVLACFLFMAAVGSFVTGPLSDRIGRWQVVSLSLLVAAPAMLAFLYAPSSYVFVTAGVTGLLLSSSTPVTIVMMQELLPRNLGVASGVALGLAFGVGGLGTSVTGLLADNWGLVPALASLTILPVAAGLGAIALPLIRPRSVLGLAGDRM